MRTRKAYVNFSSQICWAPFRWIDPTPLLYRLGVWRKKRTKIEFSISNYWSMIAINIQLSDQYLTRIVTRTDWKYVITLWYDQRSEDGIDPYDLMAVVWWDAPNANPFNEWCLNWWRVYWFEVGLEVEDSLSRSSRHCPQRCAVCRSSYRIEPVGL